MTEAEVAAAKQRALEQVQREQRERQHQLDEEAAYLADRAQVAADEARYRAEKSRFFDIAISGGGIIIKPLQSVAEFLAEARSMHHCVFSNRYFAKPQSLILHAIVNGELQKPLKSTLKPSSSSSREAATTNAPSTTTASSP